MQYNLSIIQKDAQRGLRCAQDYNAFIDQCIQDGTLQKAIDYVLRGYTGESQQKCVEKCMLLYMRHMGEETIPLWTVPPGDATLNSTFKNT